MASRSKVYSRLKTEPQTKTTEEYGSDDARRQGGDDFSNFPTLKPTERDPRFESQLPVRVPWREIVLAVFLLLLGTSMYVVAILCHYGHIHPERVSKGGFVALGSLVFLPGFYMTRIAYYTWRGYKGYSFDYIPHQETGGKDPIIGNVNYLLMRSVMHIGTAFAFLYTIHFSFKG